ncbi:MAG: AIR synthase-related protein, partial [Candidatus Bathyarchaeota archaeon]
EISHPARGRYTGRYSYDDYVDELGSTVGEALLCPTRLFSLIALKVLEKHGSTVHGMVHNTGGGNTKCLRLGKGIRYVKEMPPYDPIFDLIQRESGVEWREMYQDFNMGVGFEFIVDPEAAEDILSVVEGYGVDAQVIGCCEASASGNKLELKSGKGRFEYI